MDETQYELNQKLAADLRSLADMLDSNEGMPMHKAGIREITYHVLGDNYNECARQFHEHATYLEDVAEYYGPGVVTFNEEFEAFSGGHVHHRAILTMPNRRLRYVVLWIVKLTPDPEPVAAMNFGDGTR